MQEIIARHPVVAILRHLPLAQTQDYARAVLQGGIRAFEVALNTPHALEQIRLLRDTFSGEDILVGAGTAITPELCAKAVDAGAQFLLTPSTHPEVLQYCSAHAIPLLPGVMTPTDVAVCVNHGYNILKLFPAGDLPKGYIKSLKGPFDRTEYVAVGGVGPQNIRNFFDEGYIGVGIGSNLIPKEHITSGRWDQATQAVASLVQSIANVTSVTK